MACNLSNTKEMVIKSSKFLLLLLILFDFNSKLIAQCKTDSLQVLGPGVVEYDPGFFNRTLDNVVDSLIVYPLTAIKDNIQGVVFIQCWVETDGTTSSCKIIKGVREDIDQEALRIGNLLVFDEPARQRGKPIRIEYPIAVRFILKIE
jgi:TonB family protein